MAADQDPTTERIEGPTPAGGAYAMAHYRDDDGNPAPKGSATHVEIIEYDRHDRAIHRTHGTLRRD